MAGGTGDELSFDKFVRNEFGQRSRAAAELARSDSGGRIPWMGCAILVPKVTEPPHRGGFFMAGGTGDELSFDKFVRNEFGQRSRAAAELARSDSGGRIPWMGCAILVPKVT